MTGKITLLKFFETSNISSILKINYNSELKEFSIMVSSQMNATDSWTAVFIKAILQIYVCLRIRKGFLL